MNLRIPVLTRLIFKIADLLDTFTDELVEIIHAMTY